jgi:outer membrane protein insertion porin family
MRRVVWALALFVVIVAARAARGQVEEPVVREVQIRFVGPETVHPSVVRANIQTVVGQTRSRELIEQDVRNLINTGYFFDVRVLEESVVDGVKIIYQIRGKATVKEVVFEGQKHFKEVRLRRELTLKSGDILDELKIQQGVLQITEMYQKAGFPDVKVEQEISIDRDTGKAVVRIKTTEGNRVFIKDIRFTGNKAIVQPRLARLMKTRRRWWGSWLAGTGVLKEDQFKEDLEKLREFYHSQGYMDMEIRDVRLDRISERFMLIHIDLFEGVQYKVGAIQIAGNKLFPATELEKRLRMTEGKTFAPDGLTADIKALENFYGARGYLDTTVRSTRVPNVDTGRLDLNYSIHEGELNYIQKVEIRGNTKTKDKVIRRELPVVPGEIYNTVRIERGAERLRNLGFFSKVETIPEPTEVANRKDLVITVEEQRTGSVTFGAGFSSIDNLIGFVEITQGNFDLFNPPAFTGGGQKLRIRTQVGLERQDYIISFVEPWFLDQRLLLGVDAFHRRSFFLSALFDETRTGGALRLEKALSEFVRVGVEYSIQNIDLRVDNSATLELQAERGARLRSAMAGTLVYDTRDSVFLTTRGNRTEFSAELLGGPFGGDVSVYKLNAKTTFYFPFFEKHVLQLLLAAGVADAYGASVGDGPLVTEIVVTDGVTNMVPRRVNDVPIFDRYFLGGANTLRGFSFRKVGPKDVEGEPIGGNTYVNATAEYTLPVIERVRFAVFVDAGEVRRDSYSFALGDLAADVGAGVRLNLPIGPLRLDYGYPIITDRLTGRTGKIQFSVGYQF